MSRSRLLLTDNYGQRSEISSVPAQIGSGVNRAVAVDAPDVLDLHAELRFENSDWVLWDLSEGRGISVNGELVQTSRILKDGDVITVGSAILRVTIQERATADLSVFRSAGDTGFAVMAPVTVPSEAGTKYCYNCRQPVDQAAKFCTSCGAPQQPIAVQPAGRRSRTTAAVLAILLGSFGLHKFYLGQPGQGVVYLLFCWTWIPGIIGVIEGIQYLSMNDQQFAAKYG